MSCRSGVGLGETTPGARSDASGAEDMLGSRGTFKDEETVSPG